jgi:hypothetical protein
MSSVECIAKVTSRVKCEWLDESVTDLWAKEETGKSLGCLFETQPLRHSQLASLVKLTCLCTPLYKGNSRYTITTPLPPPPPPMTQLEFIYSTVNT